MTDDERLERNAKIYAERQEGATFLELASRYGVSAERVRQIYLRYARRAEALQYKRLYDTRLHLYNLEQAKNRIYLIRKITGKPLTESDKILLEKLDSLIAVYKEM